MRYEYVVHFMTVVVVVLCRLKDAKEQVLVKEKSCKDGQKAYAKEQSTVKNLQKELTVIEVSL